MQTETFTDNKVIEDFENFLSNKDFPCVAARAALTKSTIQYFVAEHMACPKDDRAIVEFLYNFVDNFRSTNDPFNSAVIIFKGPESVQEEMFDKLLWARLQSISNIDAQNNSYDKRVDLDPSSPNFSFSVKEEAFFVIGLNPGSSRLARKFKYPALVFNPHAQFEKLRNENRYEKMKNIVRKRDIEYSGSVNPMLTDFGERSEVFQYSGKPHDGSWKCPLNIKYKQQ